MENTVAELVFVPAPVVGHITSIVQMAKLFVNRDQRISITVLLIHPPYAFSPLSTYIQSLTNKVMDRICFVNLPQDPTPPKLHSKSPMASFNHYINSHRKYVRNIVAGSSRVAGFVIDMLCTGMIDVANAFNLPTYVFFTSSAAFLGFKFYMQTLCDDENQDVVELSNSDAMISVPFFVTPVPTTVFPSMVRTREGVDIFVSSARELRRAKAIMVNTFLELETHAFQWLSSDNSNSIPPVYPVGPLLDLEVEGGGLQNDVMRWLDSQPPSTVVFLCFGSMGSFDEVQVKEIAHALERSGHRFLWSLRRPPSDEVVLPEGFLERTAATGRVIGMDPPVMRLLSHHAVGGFVCHCEWDWLLGCLWLGVPSATWPLYAEQQMSAFEMVVELGLGVEIKMDYQMDLFNPKADNDIVIVRADEIESGIRRLMEDDTLRTKVKEMRKKSRAAAAKGGSSYASLGALIHEFMSNIC